jgi:hypothetical protein
MTNIPNQKDFLPCATTDAPITAPRAYETRQQLEIRLRLASPKRGNPGAILAPQADASDCPLFVSANEPRLF